MTGFPLYTAEQIVGEGKLVGVSGQDFPRHAVQGWVWAGEMQNWSSLLLQAEVVVFKHLGGDGGHMQI